MPEKGQHQSPVGVGEAISRIENYGLCEVLDRLFRLGHVVVGDALIYVGRGISGVEQDSLIEVVDGQVIIAFGAVGEPPVAVGEPPVDVGLYVRRVDGYRIAGVVDGQLVPALLAVNEPPIKKASVFLGSNSIAQL